MRAWLGRLAPLSGVVFFVVTAVAVFATPSSPNSDASAAKAVSFFTSHRTSQLASAFLIWYAALFVVLFAASLRSYLRARAGSNGLVALGFAGGAVYALALSILAGFLYAAADVASKISPSAEQALNVLQNDMFPIVFVTTAVFMFGYGLAISRTDALPRWLGWIAILIAVIAAVPPVSFVAFLALPVWVLVVSVVVFLREGKAAPRASTSPAQTQRSH
jgi:hypothetical protein